MKPIMTDSSLILNEDYYYIKEMLYSGWLGCEVVSAIVLQQKLSWIPSKSH